METIIEHIETGLVTVTHFDSVTKEPGEMLEVTSLQEAEEKYTIIGELYNGEINFYEESEEDWYDYKEDFGLLEEDEEDC